MVLLPEERGMTLAELRQIAARQQHQIEAQQQLLVAKEQRLKFLKQQEARHHALSEQQLETNCLLNLQDKVNAQEIKLRHLRSLRCQVDQQKTNNGNLGTELESIRALFCEKEKELNLAVNKVEDLTRQLDEIRKNSQKNYFVSSTSDLENLRRELLYRTKLSEQQNNYICQQREKIAFTQQDIFILDNKINELNKRLQSKRLLNEHFTSQIHTVSLPYNSSSLNSSLLMKKESRTQEVSEPEQTQDDLSTHLQGHHKYGFGEFSLTKKDPKYQTLPYNTKFSLKDRQLEDSLSSSTEEDSWSSRSENLGNDSKNAKHFSNMCHFSPRPFNGAQKVGLQISTNNNQQISKDTEIVPSESNCSQKENVQDSAVNKTLSCDLNNRDQPQATRKTLKPVVPPKPALSVKPMFVNKDNAKRKDSTEVDNVSTALSVLKSKSSVKDKNDFRYAGAHDSSHDPLLPKSRILTYFSKTLLQPDSCGPKPNDKIELSETPKRKSAFGQLPIKPKPLTIKKNPSIEPPKLKVQPVASLTPCRKVIESQPVPVKCLLTSEVIGKDDLGDFMDEKDVRIENKALSNQLSVVNEEFCEIASDEADCAVDSSSCHPSNMYKIKKGNLKCEGTLRGSRRVSFDPLALLLDAALEGELELVKKTANEVVNPSAANDEGITALHNAICAGHFDVVKFLVEFGCDVNAQDSDGWTPLHCAASCNNLAMVKFLVERGACIFATTLSDQETAAEKCEEDEEGFDGCSEYLFSLQDNLGIINSGEVYAVYDYDVQNADELSFKNGDMLAVLRKSDDEENEWWWSRLNDEEGYVPRNLLGLYSRVTSPKSKKSS